jgi:N-acetylmuramoyl-L-alanine amidase
VIALGILLVGAAASAAPASRAVARTAVTPAPRRPDAALFDEAKQAETALRASPRRAARPAEWEKVVLLYRRVGARYPNSGLSDDALLTIGNLYREMGTRFKSPRYDDDAAAAYKRLVADYPRSHLGENALFAMVEMAQATGDSRRIAAAGKAYLDACPDATRAREVKALLRRREPQAPLPSPPPPGLAGVFDLRAWSGDSSTRVVIDLERKVKLTYDRIGDPDRLWVDLVGARLHPNLKNRSFPVGDGLLEKIRVGQNKDDVVRVVLDFKNVKEHSVFFLEDPTRLVIDVRGAPGSGSSVPGAAPSAAPPVDSLPTRRLDGLAAAEPGARNPVAPRPAAPLAINGAVLPAPSPTPLARDAGGRRRAAPEPPDTNRAGSYSLARQLGLGARRIVIDAGHGGHDPGTIGRAGLQEKDLVLDVSLKVEKLVRAELGAEVIMTRSTDAYVPLEERTAIANSKGADLFLSIHANASRNPSARGIETYFLNFAQNPQAEAVAARENAISEATLKDLQQLVKAITLNSKIDESHDFAASVQEAMVQGIRTSHPVEDRGVHTAPFYVLIGANMPSVLAEIAFVSNPEDEKRLTAPEYRELIARALFRGVKSYLEALNRTQMRQLTGTSPRSTVAEKDRGR